jgi:hypothetical protein
MTKLSINIQDNPPPDAASVSAACDDFDTRIQTLAVKMTESNKKTKGHHAGFSDHDLKERLDIRALDRTIQTWRSSTSSKRDWPARQKGVLITVLQAEAYRPQLYQSPLIRNLRSDLVKVVNKHRLRRHAKWTPWEEPFYQSVGEHLLEYDEESDPDVLRSIVMERQILWRQKRSIQGAVDILQRLPEAVGLNGLLDAGVGRVLTNLVTVSHNILFPAQKT